MDRHNSGNRDRGHRYRSRHSGRSPSAGAQPGERALIVRVHDLSVSFPIDGEPVDVVSGASFDLGRGETLGIAGESGSGKSMTVLSLLRLVPKPGAVSDRARVVVGDIDVYTCPDDDLRHIRGGVVGTVFQNPAAAFNPVIPIGSQIAETLLAHVDTPAEAARDRATEALGAAGLESSAEMYRAYAHELSGGMQQRAAIAMALACDPDVLLADEPTTALDVTVQAQIIGLLRDLVRTREMSMIVVSHDLGVINQLADRVLIMYAGRIVESAPTRDLLGHPAHPYTRALIQAIPNPEALEEAIPPRGRQPLPIERLRGCAYAPRCPQAMDRCRTHTPPDFPAGDGRVAACWLLETVE